MTASQPLGSATMYAYHVCLPLGGGDKEGDVQSRVGLQRYLLIWKTATFTAKI